MSRQRILVIDNYDSFTFNLVQYIGSLGSDPMVYRNDQIDVRRVADLNPDKIVISPGPGVPADAGCTEAVIEAFHNTVPIFGICLGHQAIAEVFGGKVVRADSLVHGKTSEVEHHGDPLFAGIASPFAATRYHSLTVERSSLPAAVNVTAWTGTGTVMALRVADSQTVGVQFHPESYLTTDGMKIMENFLCFTN